MMQTDKPEGWSTLTLRRDAKGVLVRYNSEIVQAFCLFCGQLLSTRSVDQMEGMELATVDALADLDGHLAADHSCATN